MFTIIGLLDKIQSAILSNSTLNMHMVDMVNVTAQSFSYFSAKFNCQRGHLTYERIPNHKLIGFQDKVVSALSR